MLKSGIFSRILLGLVLTYLAGTLLYYLPSTIQACADVAGLH